MSYAGTWAFSSESIWQTGAGKMLIIIIYSLNFPYLRVLALSISPNRTVSSVLNIYQFRL